MSSFQFGCLPSQCWSSSAFLCIGWLQDQSMGSQEKQVKAISQSINLKLLPVRCLQCILCGNQELMGVEGGGWGGGRHNGACTQNVTIWEVKPNSLIWKLNCFTRNASNTTTILASNYNKVPVQRECLDLFRH